MNNLLENLNKEQLAAVMHKDGPLLIVAGAGTGKTTAITQRIAYLIEQGKAQSDEVLALTFTEKAAGEMEERVDRLLPMGYLDLWISTFHSFGERILHEHGLEIGLPGDFRVLNEFEQWALIRKNSDKFDLDYYRPLGNPTKFIHALVKHFSRAKDEDVSPAEYLEYAEELKENLDAMMNGRGKGYKKQDTRIQTNPKSQIPNPKQILRQRRISLGLKNSKFKILNVTNAGGELDRELADQEVLRINEVANAYHVYQQLLLDNNALDFGDLINYCLKLFRERPAILEKYRRQFKYILLDEFQDTNWAQYELIKLLAAPKNNLVVVGDDDQSIYKFRGASLSNILQFKQDYPDTKEIVLVKNYRNRQNILDLSYGFIQLNNPNRLEYQLNVKTFQPKAGPPQAEKHKNIPAKGWSASGGKTKQRSLDKKLVAQKDGKGVVEVIRGEDLGEEVRMVIERIADLKIADKSVSWNDFAILVRANDSAREFCHALDIAGLPYQFLASRGLYTRPVVMDVIAYLKLLDNYHESPALYRILKLPVFGFSYQELVNLTYWANRKAWSLYEVMRNAGILKLGVDTESKTAAVLNLIDKHTTLAHDRSVTEVILAFLDDSGYLKHIVGGDERESREATVCLNQFMKRIKRFEAASDEKNTKTFLEELDMEIDAGEQGALTPDPDAGPEAVKVMTVHAAKGLEFKYVFITNLVDRRFPTIERKDPIELPDVLVKEIVPEGDIHLEEERRLFYVAMTRAEQGLFFSWAPDYGGVREKKPSRFLAECGLVDTPRDVKVTLKSAKKQDKLSVTAVVRDRTGVRAGGAGYKLPSYFSYTQLAAFANCPYQYRFAHVLKVPRRGKFTFSYGQTMHLTLQKMFQSVQEKQGIKQSSLFGDASVSASGLRRGQSKNAVGAQNIVPEVDADISLKEILAIYEQCWIDDWYESKKQKEEYRKKGRESLKKYHELHNRKWPRVESLEQGLRFRLDGYSIYGKIDRIDDLGERGLRIVDYKTGTPKQTDKISANDKEQLLLYQIGAEQALGRKICDLQFYYLDDNSELNFLGSEADVTGMRERAVARIHEIEKAFACNEFPPKPSQLCRFCDFYDVCEFRKS